MQSQKYPLNVITENLIRAIYEKAGLMQIEMTLTQLDEEHWKLEVRHDGLTKYRDITNLFINTLGRSPLDLAIQHPSEYGFFVIGKYKDTECDVNLLYRLIAESISDELRIKKIELTRELKRVNELQNEFGAMTLAAALKDPAG